MREQLLKANAGKWSSIASSHVALMLEPDVERVQKQAKGYDLLRNSEVSRLVRCPD